MVILDEHLITYIFISVGVLVLRLFRCWHITIRAVVLTVVIGSTMVRYNHQLLDVSLETWKNRKWTNTSRITNRQTINRCKDARPVFSVGGLNNLNK